MKLERLRRYVARPAIANERLKLTKCGQVALTLKTPFRESLPREQSECFGYGTKHIVMSPLELLQKLAALAPKSFVTLGVGSAQTKDEPDSVSWSMGSEIEDPL